MDILQQCQKWHENGAYQKIIDALEALSERILGEDSGLAHAYNNLAGKSYPEGRDLLRNAIALLKPHEESFAGDHFWKFRMGYAYYYLNQKGRALPDFRTALKVCPNDEDTIELIVWCGKGIAPPRFHESFRGRTKAAWGEVADREAKLHQLLGQGSEDATERALVDTLRQSTA